MTDTKPTNGLRFGALVRVSTERQEQEGESLHTQRADAERDVAQLGGTITEWYGGQEHATPGFEKKEVNRLIADAAQGKFDAVIVNTTDRWSRDNRKSEEGLAVLREHGIRFFVRTTEYDLFNEDEDFRLSLDVAIARRQARSYARRSLRNRIERAKQGRPTSGARPFGRAWDRKTEQWHIIPEKQALLQDVANRYIAGEGIRALAVEYHVNYGHLHYVLRTQAGNTWQQRFRSKSLNIDETVLTPVPPLLDEDTIQAVRERARANKTYRHGQIKYRYLLGRVIFCAHCGSAYRGYEKRRKTYYRHNREGTAARTCPHRHPRVRAEELEQAVLHQLFDLFGNPAKVQKAAEAATLNREKAHELRQRQERYSKELGEVAPARGRIIKYISKGTITDKDAEAELDDLRRREVLLKAQLDKLRAELENSVTDEEVRAAAEKSSRGFKRRFPTVSALEWARTRTINEDYEGMSWDEARELVQLVFGGLTPDGRRMGVYVECTPGQGRKHNKEWSFQVRGRLVEQWGFSPHLPHQPVDHEDVEFSGGPLQKGLLSAGGARASGDPTSAPSLPRYTPPARR